MRLFEVKTKENSVLVKCYSGYIDKEKIKVERELFAKMCKEGCRNYGNKYSCPPFAPSFDSLMKGYDGVFIVMLLSDLDEIDSTEYNKVRIVNAVMKSRIKRLMKDLEKIFGANFLSSGSCNLCKRCKLQDKLPCKHPDDKRYSLEATGVDCNDISKQLFDIELLWYKEKKAPKYSSIMCGLPCNKKDVKDVEKEVENYKFEGSLRKG